MRSTSSIVLKFGGSSLSCAAQFQKAADIIHADSARRYVVVSAPGKRDDGDVKITDMLYACYDLAKTNQPCESNDKNCPCSQTRRTNAEHGQKPAGAEIVHQECAEESEYKEQTHGQNVIVLCHSF